MKESSVSALLFCNDSQLLCTVDRVFNDNAVLTDVCLSLDGVQDALKEDTFDLLAIDLDEPEAAAVISLWSNRGPKASKVVIAFASKVETMRQVRGRVHFMVQKPLSTSLLGRTLKAAKGTLIQKRRLAPRHAVQMPAKISVIHNGSKQPLFREMLLDLSAGGFCMKTEPVVAMGTTVEIEFVIPDSTTMVRAKGTVMWSELTGVAGVKFISVPAAEMVKLKAWTEDSANIATSMPANVAAALTDGSKNYMRKG
jgi:PilZ domain